MFILVNVATAKQNSQIEKSSNPPQSISIQQDTEEVTHGFSSDRQRKAYKDF